MPECSPGPDPEQFGETANVAVPKPPEPGREMLAEGTQVLAAWVSQSDLPTLIAQRFSGEALGKADYRQGSVGLQRIDALHDLIRLHGEAMADNLQHRLTTRQYHEVAEGVFSAEPDATLGPHIATCTQDGPIVMEAGCQLGPFTFLQGPVYLGPGCRVAEHSSLKEGVCAGTRCKLGGEVEATIMESFSNKQHHGFLGHSYLGSWINLGAGTSNSDLKNTYGKVTMRRQSTRIDTGMQFVGCFVGDYSKTAINTSIFTGKTIGVCSMLYGFASQDVAPFTNHAQNWGQVTEVDPQVMMETQRRMFGRRQVVQRDCDRQLIESMFELTRDQRIGLPCQPLVF